MNNTNQNGVDENELSFKEVNKNIEDTLSCCNFQNKHEHLLGSSNSKTTISANSFNLSSTHSLFSALE